jgi:hypothetical protein
MTKLVENEPNYERLLPLVGTLVRIGQLFETPRHGVLHMWTADNGNQGWVVGDLPGMNEKANYILFSGDAVAHVQGNTIYLT